MRVVIYHANCADGFCAAWLAHKAWPDAEFIPANYGDEPPDVKGKHVIIVDFSYKRPVLEKMYSEAASLVVLDHHKTAEAELTGLPYATFDMNKSGAHLIWDYLGFVAHNWVMNYVEDRDLWRWQLPDSREISATISSYPMSFNHWDELYKRRPILAAKEGHAILRCQKQIIEKHVKNAYETQLGDHKVLCCNATTLISEIGEALGKDRPFSITYFYNGDEYIYSLRSHKDGVDVSEIAKEFGGGGHKHAAGFKLGWLIT